MTTRLPIASRLHVTPLFDIQHPPFAKLYRDGVYWSLFNERCASPLTDRSFLTNLRETLNNADGVEQHGTIGFHFGRLHGAILSPDTGRPRAGVTTLASFQHMEAARGYAIGREWYFTDASPAERTHSDASVLEVLHQLQHDSLRFHDEEATWYYALGSLLGELSGSLFPAAHEEYIHWQEEERRFWAAQVG
ncbi:MAG: hypothetical protein ACRDIV_16365 [Ktedonobacteraceae bacterium]